MIEIKLLAFVKALVDKRFCVSLLICNLYHNASDVELVEAYNIIGMKIKNLKIGI